MQHESLKALESLTATLLAKIQFVYGSFVSGKYFGVPLEACFIEVMGRSLPA